MAKTDEILLNLDQFKGVVAFDEDKSQCTVQAGTRLYDLGKYVAPINQSLANQGDIDQQSLAVLFPPAPRHRYGFSLSYLPLLKALNCSPQMATAAM